MLVRSWKRPRLDLRPLNGNFSVVNKRAIKNSRQSETREKIIFVIMWNVRGYNHLTKYHLQSMSQAVPSWTSDFRRSRESKSVAKSTAKHKKFVAHLAASQVGSFIAPGLALDGFSLTSHASSHTSHNNDGELQSGRGFAVGALLLRMPNSWRTHHDRSGNCALRFVAAHKAEFRRLLSLCVSQFLLLCQGMMLLWTRSKNAESYLWTVFTKIYRHELRFFLIASRRARECR